MSALSEELRARVVENLARHPRESCALDGRKPAAVAIALVDDAAGAACFVLTRRAPRL
jgi:hypothetical protein